MTWLDLLDNKLSSIDVSNNTALISLDLGGNQLTAIDVSNNTALTHLELGSNKLTAINLLNNTALTSLGLRDNNFADVDISKNINIETLRIDDNVLVETGIVPQADNNGYVYDFGNLKFIKDGEHYYPYGLETYIICNLDFSAQTTDFIAYDENTMFATVTNPKALTDRYVQIYGISVRSSNGDLYLVPGFSYRLSLADLPEPEEEPEQPEEDVIVPNTSPAAPDTGSDIDIDIDVVNYSNVATNYVLSVLIAILVGTITVISFLKYSTRQQ